jgi:predicted Zn-dependent protease
MELAELIKHPEQLDRDTLYELRSMLALHPYYQTARLVMLHNLYLLHDPTFDEELRKAAMYVTDRRTLFNMVEAAHYQLQGKKEQQTVGQQANRTVALIDDFLESIPQEDEEEQLAKPKRKPTPADAAIDYVAYLLATEDESQALKANIPQMKGQDLIDTFLEQEKGHIVLNELPQMVDATQNSDQEEEGEEEYFTETLARIYIKQGRYQKALDIIGRLHEKYPHKNAYFADQMRFLEKLIINNSNNNNKK